MVVNKTSHCSIPDCTDDCDDDDDDDQHNDHADFMALSILREAGMTLVSD